MIDEAWLPRAAEHVFSAGVADAADALCQANARYGLAKLHFVQARLGRNPCATFVGAPDATVTRNTQRWRGGFGYGGRLQWDADLAVLDALPNGCGMLVGALPRQPQARRVCRAAREARTASLVVDDVPLIYDLAESNHFVDVCELEQVLCDNPPPLPSDLFVIHSSGTEHRAASPFGPGLYVHQSERLRQRARLFDTPWGTLSILSGSDASDFYQFCDRVQRFNARRRQRYAEFIFGDFDTVVDATHQGFRTPGVMHLGSNWFDPDRSQLLPLALGPDQPVYLLRPRPNLSPTALEQLGWAPRARRLGLLDMLGNLNFLPHGGGYAFPGIERVVHVESRGDNRRFIVEAKGATMCIEDVRALPFVYRELAVLTRAIELEMAQPVARYRIRLVIKD